MVDFMQLAIITPTRQRPERRKTFHDSVRSLADDNDSLRMYYYLDNDDPAMEQYRETELHAPQATDVVGEPMSVSKSWNILAKLAIDEGADVLIMGNDDLVYETQGWDTKLRLELDKFPDKIYCMWFQDKLNGKGHCAFPIVSKEWYHCLGYFTPGIFNFGYNDTWIFDIGKKLGRCHWIPHVVMEHKHISKYRSLLDETYKRNRVGPRGNLYEKDAPIFASTDDVRKEHAEKLRALMR
jgi:glycosyl transferase/beta-hydroxylase protein BlmF